MIGSSKLGLPVLIASFAAMSAMSADSGDMKPNGCKGPTLCHTRPDIDSNDFLINIGFILEQARLTGTMYGYTLNDNATPSSNAQSASGRRPSFNLDWGVTVGVGRHFAHDDWDLTVDFDWLSSTGKDSTSTDFSQRIVPINLRTSNAIDGSTDLIYADTASSKFRTRYYMLDVALGRGAFMGSCSSICPHFGIKAAWIDYINSLRLTGGNLSTGSSGQTYHLRQNDEFWGVGPNVGLDATWGMSEGIGVFFDSDVAILLGYARASDHSYSSQDSNAYTMKFDENNVPVMSPTIKTNLGIQYQQPVYCGRQHIRIRAGWDTAFYFNQYFHSVILNENPDNHPKFHAEETNTFSITGLRMDLTWDF